jgi:hypothetical protein
VEEEAEDGAGEHEWVGEHSGELHGGALRQRVLCGKRGERGRAPRGIVWCFLRIYEGFTYACLSLLRWTHFIHRPHKEYSLKCWSIGNKHKQQINCTCAANTQCRNTNFETWVVTQETSKCGALWGDHFSFWTFGRLVVRVCIWFFSYL